MTHSKRGANDLVKHMRIYHSNVVNLIFIFTKSCQLNFTNFKIIRNVKESCCVCDVVECLCISGRV
jgi:hypothetical protein